MWPRWSRRAASAPMPATTSRPCARQIGRALPGDERMRIFDGVDEPGDAGGDDRLAAGRRPPVVAARFEGHVEGRAPRRRAPACASAIVSPCGRPPSPVTPRPTMRPSLDDEGADRGVRRRPAEAAASSASAPAMKRASSDSVSSDRLSPSTGAELVIPSVTRGSARAWASCRPGSSSGVIGKFVDQHD